MDELSASVRRGSLATGRRGKSFEKSSKSHVFDRSCHSTVVVFANSLSSYKILKFIHEHRAPLCSHVCEEYTNA